MTTSPSPAAKDPTVTEPDKAPAPFDPQDFPPNLRDAQRRAAELYAELHAFQATLPWSRDPHPGWPNETERGKEREGRPETAGWTDEQADAYDNLLADLRKATAAVQSHSWWKRCGQEGVKGADLVDVRQALKYAKGAVALGRNDVEQTA
ncbi:hypothetical protein [Streptomyces sp. NPDC050535]|uniref:hypothetical protein n=1 Tax=Streptomyces sp. NPDC050535 TaxID=3365626 RepID=UPI00379DE578